MHINSRKCCLCHDTLNESRRHFLFDRNGRNTEIYKITVKYFDANLFIADEDIDPNNEHSEMYIDALHYSMVICTLCWRHIREFHDFQQCVLQSLIKLTNDNNYSLPEVENDTESRIELDNGHDLDNINAIGGEIVLIMENNDTEYLENDYINEDDDDENIDIKTNTKDHEGEYLKNKKQTKIKKIKKIKDNQRDCSKKSLVPRNCRKLRKSSVPNNDVDHSMMMIMKKDKIKSNNNTENVNQSETLKDNTEELLVPTAKSPNFKTKKSLILKDDNDDDTKNERYNCTKKTRELDNFITEVKPQLECDICKEIHLNYNELRRHFTEKHQTKCFVICCDKKIYRRYLLVEHLRVHVNPDSYKCDICGVSNSSSRSLNAHRRFMHTTVKTFECDICGRHFKTKAILIRHMETHNNNGVKDFKCPECDRCYGSDYQVKAHINKIHLESQICDHCGKTMHGLNALKQHIINQHSEIKPTKFPCNQCDAELASKKSLNAHKLSFHNDGLTAFICRVCGKMTSSESALLRHKKYVHEMERKFKCQYCDKAFKKNINLKEHISSLHTGEHLYKCYHCVKTFSSCANMHTHRSRVHPEEFALSRENRNVIPKVDLNCVVKEIFL